VPPSHPAYLINLGFWAMLTSRTRGARWAGIEDFTGPIERISAPYYGVDSEELWRRASAKEWIDSARVPVLVLHPEDDNVIPVEHARMLERAAARNERVRIWVLPGGGHGAIDAVDGPWFYAVVRGFFERWAGYGGDEAGSAVDARQDRVEGKLIYSAAS
jgi:pimeloyl-ACP methyl ester carboxylesterase